MMDLRISVIIPVYNAAAYVAQAVDSALEQPETGEVILVEDGSQDASLEVCRMLAEENLQVRLYQHPNGGNRVAGPSLTSQQPAESVNLFRADPCAARRDEALATESCLDGGRNPLDVSDFRR